MTLRTLAAWAFHAVTGTLPFLALLSTLGLMVTSGICFAFLKTRHFSSDTSKIEADAILKLLPQYSQWSKSEIYIQGIGWVPRWVVSVGFFAAIATAPSSDRRRGNQVFHITIWRWSCLSWESFDALLRTPRAAHAGHEERADGDRRLPTTLNHLVQSSAYHAYPDWTVLSKCAHPPGTPESELSQSDAIARMALTQLNAFGSAVVVVRGPAGVGKTGAGMRLAQLLGPNTVVCTRFDPTRPGNLTSQLMKARTEHDTDATLIIFRDEFDVTLDHLGAIAPNTELMVEVVAKDSWNDWLDDVHRCKRVVLWLTSNAGDAKIATYDPSLLRERRVTAHYHATGSAAFHAVHERQPSVGSERRETDCGHPESSRVSSEETETETVTATETDTDTD